MSVTSPDEIWTPDSTDLYRLVLHLSAMADSVQAALISRGSPVGVVNEFAGSVAPTGWLMCNGQAVSRLTYASLFAVIGTAWGTGDGSTTFNLPDFRGRTPVGVDSTQTEFDALNKSGGAKTHTHTEGNLRAAIGATGFDTASIGYQALDPQPSGRGPAATSAYTIAGGPKAGAQTFNHYTGVYGITAPGDSLSPYRAINFIIKVS